MKEASVSTKSNNDKNKSDIGDAATKTTSTSTSTTTDWVQATDWDDPLQTAVLYNHKSSSSSSVSSNNDKHVVAVAVAVGCGHSIQWNPKVLVTLKTCPICQEPVTLICDGMVRATTTTTSTSTSTSAESNKQQQQQSKNNDDTTTTTTNNIMTCKFGKQIYRLSVLPTTTTSKSKSNDASTTNNNNNTSHGLLHWMLSFLPSSSSSSSSGDATPITAQERIQTALGLVDGFRILYKAKVIYPPPTATTTTSTSTNTNQYKSSLKISQQLLQLSQLEWNATTNTNTTNKVNIVIMGTQHGKELQDRPKDPSKPQISLSQLLQLPFYIIRYGISGTWWFLVSFFKPFIPQAYLPDDYNTTNNDNDDDHPHRD